MPETVDCHRAVPLSIRHVFTTYCILLRNGLMLRYIMLSCLISSIMLSWNAVSPFLLIDAMSGRTTLFVTAQAFLYGSFIVGTRLASHIIETREAEVLIWLGFKLCFAGILLSLTATFMTINPIPAIVLFGGFMLGAGLLSPPLFRRTVEISDAPMGTSMAVLSSGMSLSATAAIGVTALLGIQDLSHYYSLALFLTTLALMLARSCLRLTHKSSEKG